MTHQPTMIPILHLNDAPLVVSRATHASLLPGMTGVVGARHAVPPRPRRR